MERPTIGARIRYARTARGLTQPALAERARVSLDTVRSLEQGRRSIPHTTTLTRIAEACGVPLTDLLGRHEQFGPDASMIPLRNAILTVDDLPGIEPFSDGEAVPAGHLAASVARTWDMYWAGNLAGVATTAPGLLRGARAAARSGAVAVSSLLAQAYQLAACACVQVGHDGLGYAAAARGARAAGDGSDPLQKATLLGTASWALLHQARHAEAEHVASHAAKIGRAHV